jgi:hypothetical protein
MNILDLLKDPFSYSILDDNDKVFEEKPENKSKVKPPFDWAGHIMATLLISVFVLFWIFMLIYVIISIVSVL